MTVRVLALRGCRPQPLAHYLKSLGIFRLVAEQRDPTARAFFKNDVFHLVSALDADGLVAFLCDEFAPSPVISPWNGGSGFYPKDTRAALDAIADSTSQRFEPYRDAIRAARAVVGGRKERPAEDAKSDMLVAFQNRSSESALAWLTAAVTVDRGGDGRFPALLGTGGNDGRLEFSNNLMQRLVELIDPSSGKASIEARGLARAALFGDVERGLISAAIGQFHPGGAGGANATSGFDAESLFNPWDFVLALEGAILLRSAALRRLDGAGLSLAGAPFALRGLAGGYASATDADDDGRGEQWMPLWNAPASLREVEAIFAEGRLVAGTHRPRGALDAARAIAQLGVARGITAFERYGFMVRNGLSNLAVPIGRIETRSEPLEHVRLLDEIDPWLASLGAASRDKQAPAAFGRQLRNLQATLFDLCLTPDKANPTAWLRLVEELGDAEDLMVRSGRFTAARRLHPLPKLSSRWLEACDDGSIEFRLASALATATWRDELGPLRAHVLPLKAPYFEQFQASDDALRKEPRVVWQGHDLVDDLCRIATRRAMESNRAGINGLALAGGRYASLADISAFVLGTTDERRLARILRGLLSVGEESSAPLPSEPLPIYALFRLAITDATPETVREMKRLGAKPRCDQQTLRLLSGGQVEAAGRLAHARLGAMGLRPKLRTVVGDARLGKRIAASLLFPISPHDFSSILRSVTKPAAHTPSETP